MPKHRDPFITNRRHKKPKVTQETITKLCDLYRELDLESRRCYKESFQRAAKELRAIAKILKVNGAEVDMSRATEKYYLYHIARKMVQSQED